MGKGIDTAKWAWKNKKIVLPVAVVAGVLVYANGGKEAIDAVERGTSAATAAGDSYENGGGNAPVVAIGNLVCKSAVVKVEHGKTILRVTTNKEMPGNAKLEVKAHHQGVDGWSDSWRKNFGDPGEPSAQLSTRRGPVDAAKTVITQGSAEVACPDWKAGKKAPAADAQALTGAEIGDLSAEGLPLNHADFSGAVPLIPRVEAADA